MENHFVRSVSNHLCFRVNVGISLFWFLLCSFFLLFESCHVLDILAFGHFLACSKGSSSHFFEVLHLVGGHHVLLLKWLELLPDELILLLGLLALLLLYLRL